MKNAANPLHKTEWINFHHISNPTPPISFWSKKSNKNAYQNPHIFFQQNNQIHRIKNKAANETKPMSETKKKTHLCSKIPYFSTEKNKIKFYKNHFTEVGRGEILTWTEPERGVLWRRYAPLEKGMKTNRSKGRTENSIVLLWSTKRVRSLCQAFPFYGRL